MELQEINRNATFFLPIKYKTLIQSAKPNGILEGGRLGGKTIGSAILSVCFLLEYPYTDAIFSRVSYGSLADSSYAEFQNELDKLPPIIRKQFTLKKNPLRITRQGNSGTVYFIGYGGSNTSRTKSFTPSHKIKIVVLEETQELKNRENLDQVKASLQRHYDLHNPKFLVLGNPPAQKQHWFNQFIIECKNDADWDVVHISWRDILPFINDFDLKEILKAYKKRPEFAKWFYDGIPTGAFGAVYPMFNPDYHTLTAQQFSFFLENTPVKIAGLVVGGDGAVNRDSTSFVPIFILTNGQCAIGPIFHHDPKLSGIIGSHTLVKEFVSKWFNQVLKAYNLGTYEEKLKNPYIKQVPVWFRIDSASTDLIQECKYFFGNRANVQGYKKDHVPVMVGRVQSAIDGDRLYVIDYGGYYNYVENKFVECVNPLVEQFDMLIWNEKQDNYDPIVPNDDMDALTYGTNFWFGNTENMQWFDIIKNNAIKNYSIRDKINAKETEQCQT